MLLFYKKNFKHFLSKDISWLDSLNNNSALRVLIGYISRRRDKCFDTQEKSVPHNKVKKTHNETSKNTQ